MKKYLLWTFERGSRPYDVICIVILAFIFLTPHSLFHDRPDYQPNIPTKRYTKRMMITVGPFGESK